MIDGAKNIEPIKILITGKDSYIGMSFEKWLSQWPENYRIDTIDMIDGSWKNKSFSGYDVVFHVAGIAHVLTDPKMESLYYKVNRDLAIETAVKAKEDKVKQFIFMSSIIVYGDSSEVNKERIITQSTIPNPANFYGKSKLLAEEGIINLETDDFKIAILRPPMIYGKGSKGNYPKLSRFAKKLFIFPNINNQRSMLHINNLCECIRLIINNQDKGFFYPQNKEYVCVSEMVKLIAKVNGHDIKLTKIFNNIIYFMAKKISMINKVFGNLVYDKELSNYSDFSYCVVDFEKSIQLTED